MKRMVSILNGVVHQIRKICIIEEKETLLEGEDKFETTDIKDVSNNYNFRSDGGANYVGFDEVKRWRGPIEKEEQYKYRNK